MLGALTVKRSRRRDITVNYVVQQVVAQSCHRTADVRSAPYTELRRDHRRRWLDSSLRLPLVLVRDSCNRGSRSRFLASLRPSIPVSGYQLVLRFVRPWLSSEVPSVLLLSTTLASPQSTTRVSPYSPIMMFVRLDVSVDDSTTVCVGHGLADVDEVK